MSDVKVGDIIEKGAEAIPADALAVADQDGDLWLRVAGGWLPATCADALTVGEHCTGHPSDAEPLAFAPLTVVRASTPRARTFPALDGPPSGLRKVRDDETGEVFEQWPNGFWGDDQLGWLELRGGRSLTEVLDTTEASG